MKGARGYLLMEAMLGSAVLAVTFAVAADHVAAARRGVSLASHRQTASALATAKAEEAISRLPDAALPDAAQLVAVDTAHHPGFRWRWTTTDASTGVAAASVPPIRSAAREVVVVVEYPTEKGSRDDRATLPVDDGRASIVVRRLWFRSPLPR